MKNKSFAVSMTFIWLFLFGFLPLTLIVITSFLTKNNLHLVGLPWTWANYSALWSPIFFKIFFRSLSMAALTALCCLLVAYPFSYILVKSRYQSVLLLLIMIPFWTSALVRTYALLSILKLNGLLNTLLLKLHLITHPLTLLYTPFAVFSGLVYNLFPFMVLPLFTQMEQFDFRLIEAAKDLGATRWAIFSRVFLPNTIHGIVAGCLMVLLPAMTLFYIPNVLGGARTILLGNMIQNQFLVLENWPQGAATSTVLTGLFMMLLWVFRSQGKASFA